MTTYRFGADLFGELDRLQRQMSGFAASRGRRFDAFPPINVGANDDAIEIVAFAPGMQAADFDVTIDKGLLTISGERSIASPAASFASDNVSDTESSGADNAASPASTAPAAPARPLSRERFSGRFRRAVELPSNADAGSIEARYDNGCLRIRIAKRAAAQPRSIHVQ
ncbi:Hsp20/alpha crystallin family protein [Burkholderia sp. Ac-20379]|uniref:Hsp20/alpha crystallin family protein n=1 Tax=Burkholderia sp. Ac-20379 TaxID=2703900 RepID=UPI00197F4AD7|nr:Hsp20/alpha crystallin family protein [Burkholderia sp. Ac-20379]MBN3727621.1 Hsp20/alpha crystallin family protein [Burkholderia sp. Ac-20379]